MVTQRLKLPENFGQCFDTAALAAVQFPAGAVLCHGVGVANMPGQEGHTIAHAWVEYNGRAYDTIWMVHQDIEPYRTNLQLSYCVEYSQAEVWDNWKRTDMPGPWDPKIAAHCGEDSKP